MASNITIPETMRALVLRSTSEPPTIETVPTPKPAIGGAVVKVEAANVISYIRDIYNGKRKYPFPTPIIPGSSAIVRVAAVGPDATKLQPGDLCVLDCTVRSRDNPRDVYLAAIIQGHTEGAAKLMREVYRDWAYAEYCLAPIENLTVINEKRLTGIPEHGGLGYSISQIGYISALMVPYGGLRDINLQAGQTVIVAPATGPFGGAAVIVALAMGARVIAMGRNKDSLASLKTKVPHPERVETVPITGDMEADCAELKKFGEIDAYFDIGPPEASKSSHWKSCLLALRHGAHVSLMGGYRDDMPIPHSILMHKNIGIFFKWMYERSNIADMFKLIESGMLKLGEGSGVNVVGEYPLEQWKEAWDVAAEKAGFGQIVLIKP